MTNNAIIMLHSYVSQIGYVLADSRYSQNSPSVTTMLIASGVLIGVAGIGWVGFQFWNPQAKKDCPNRLFRDLCRAHNLDWGERALLNKLAQRHQLATPAELFVSPECFDMDDGRAQQSLLQRIDDLRQKLFRAN